MSLNPALDQASFCPRCGRRATVDSPRSYYNLKQVAATIPLTNALEVEAFAPGEIPWQELAFWSTRTALEDLLGRC